MPGVRQGCPSAAEIEPRASFRWINGGAYADMGAWAKWGGRRHEPLVAPGEVAATKDPNQAALLFAERLAELRGRRELAKAGLPAPAHDVPTSIGAFIGFHLAAKAEVKGRRRPCEQELRSQRTRLLHAARFFRKRGIRDLRQLDHGAVEAYMRGDGAPIGIAFAATFRLPGAESGNDIKLIPGGNVNWHDFTFAALPGDAAPPRRVIATAAQAVGVFMNVRFTRCGESQFTRYQGFGSADVRQIHQFRGLVTRLQPAALSPADRANGLEYRATLRISAPAGIPPSICRKLEWTSSESQATTFIHPGRAVGFDLAGNLGPSWPLTQN